MQQLPNEYFLFCFSPLGMNKMVINHLEKLFVTNNAATILRELEVSSLRVSQLEETFRDENPTA